MIVAVPAVSRRYFAALMVHRTFGRRVNVVDHGVFACKVFFQVIDKKWPVFEGIYIAPCGELANHLCEQDAAALVELPINAGGAIGAVIVVGLIDNFVISLIVQHHEFFISRNEAGVNVLHVARVARRG